MKYNDKWLFWNKHKDNRTTYYLMQEYHGGFLLFIIDERLINNSSKLTKFPQPKICVELQSILSPEQPTRATKRFPIMHLGFLHHQLTKASQPSESLTSSSTLT